MNRTWKRTLVAIPSVGVSLMPKLACPLCWPAYAGLLSSVGLGFLISAKYLFPFTSAVLAVAVGALAFGAKNRRGYGPFAIGTLAAAGVLAGKFYWESNPMTYVAIALLVVASVWNVWPTWATAAVKCCPGKSVDQKTWKQVSEEN